MNSRMTPKLKHHNVSPLMLNKNVSKSLSFPVCLPCVTNCSSHFPHGFVRWRAGTTSSALCLQHVNPLLLIGTTAKQAPLLRFITPPCSMWGSKISVVKISIQYCRCGASVVEKLSNFIMGIAEPIQPLFLLSGLLIA